MFHIDEEVHRTENKKKKKGRIIMLLRSDKKLSMFIKETKRMSSYNN